MGFMTSWALMYFLSSLIRILPLKGCLKHHYYATNVALLCSSVSFDSELKNMYLLNVNRFSQG